MRAMELCKKRKTKNDYIFQTAEQINDKSSSDMDTFYYETAWKTDFNWINQMSGKT